MRKTRPVRITLQNRIEAGRLLLKEIIKRGVGKRTSFLFALPRGGTEVAFPVASGIRKQIIPLIVRKIPASYNKELAIGAVSQFGDTNFNELAELESQDYVKSAVEKTIREITERVKKFGVEFDFSSVKNKEVLIVDDGIATGESLYLAAKSLLKFKPSFIHIAVPVSSEEGFEKLSKIAEVISLITDRYFYAVSAYYEEFPQLTEDKTRRYILESSKFATRGM